MRLLPLRTRFLSEAELVASLVAAPVKLLKLVPARRGHAGAEAALPAPARRGGFQHGGNSIRGQRRVRHGGAIKTEEVEDLTQAPPIPSGTGQYEQRARYAQQNDWGMGPGPGGPGGAGMMGMGGPGGWTRNGCARMNGRAAMPRNWRRSGGRGGIGGGPAVEWVADPAWRWQRTVDRVVALADQRTRRRPRHSNWQGAPMRGLRQWTPRSAIRIWPVWFSVVPRWMREHFR